MGQPKRSQANDKDRHGSLSERVLKKSEPSEFQVSAGSVSGIWDVAGLACRVVCSLLPWKMGKLSAQLFFCLPKLSGIR